MRFRIYIAALSVAMIVGLGMAHASCTTASVTGTYGFLQSAKDSTGGIALGNGQITFNGLGSVTGTNSAFVVYSPSKGWSDSTGSAFTGTYTVASNCTGTVTLIDSGSGSKSHYSFVADNNESGSQFIRIDANGSVQLGFLVAEGTVTCGLGTTNRIFATELSGVMIGNGPVGYVGRLVFSTKGTVTGNLTVNVNGTITKPTVTGTYTEASDCTGTITITPNGLGTMNFTFVVVNSGKELLLIETDTNMVVSGNLQM
jgi:hypothetical protein